MKYIIKNAKVCDKDKFENLDILVDDGYISKLDKNISCDNSEIIDFSNYIIMPAFVDTHCHLRDPGFTYKEDIETGSKSARKGGFCLINAMANTKPVVDDIDIYNDILNRSKKLDLVDINQTMALTKSLLGKEIINIENLNDDIYILSDDGKDLLSNYTMYKAAKLCAKYNKTIMVHAEDSEISPYDYRMAEDIITIRDIHIAKVTNCHIHMSHVSTKDAISAIRNAKKQGINVTCEVCPHHIALYDNTYRVNPPIRTKEDVEEIKKAIMDGTVDCISTDHAPHSKEDKENGAPGMVGFETAFSVVYTHLVKNNIISLSKLSEIMSYGGAKILRKNNIGLIKEGYKANFAVVDINKKYIVNSENFVSKSKNTAFEGMELYGKVVASIRNGEILRYDN